MSGNYPPSHNNTHEVDPRISHVHATAVISDESLRRLKEMVGEQVASVKESVAFLAAAEEAKANNSPLYTTFQEGIDAAVNEHRGDIPEKYGEFFLLGDAPWGDIPVVLQADHPAFANPALVLFGFDSEGKRVLMADYGPQNDEDEEEFSSAFALVLDTSLSNQEVSVLIVEDKEKPPSRGEVAELLAEEIAPDDTSEIVS